MDLAESSDESARNRVDGTRSLGNDGKRREGRLWIASVSCPLRVAASFVAGEREKTTCHKKPTGM